MDLTCRTFERGDEHNTFTVVARCAETGRFGIALSTGELAVGGRVPHIAPNIGAVATQAYTDPRLGPLAIKLLELGYPAERVLTELQSSDPYKGHRQIAIVDRWGHAAVMTGTDNSAWAGHRQGKGWIAMGNAIVGENVVNAMADVLEAASPDLETRLMTALEAGVAAGGQPDGERSAGLLVYENAGFAIINLRVDDNPKPTAALRSLFDKIYPLIPYYRERPDNPTIGRVKDWAKARGIEF